MNLISYIKKSETCLGLRVSETHFIDISEHIETKDFIDLIQNFSEYESIIENLSLKEIEKELPISEHTIISPIPTPTSLRDAYSFRQHVETSRKNRGLKMIEEFDHFPVYYYSNHNSVIGPGEVLVRKSLAEMLDYELEIAIVISKKGINISAQEADDYIFGFTIMNDFSARKIQMQEMKLNLGPAQGKDFATSLGPSILTMSGISDQITPTKNGNQYNIGLKGFLNNKLISEDNLKNMTWTFAQIIERISNGTYIYPGDVIGSGTCATGCLYELNSNPALNKEPYWLKNGDLIKITADKIGSLENTVRII